MFTKVFPRNKLSGVRVIPYVEYAPTFFYPLIQGCKEDPPLAVKVHQTVNPGDILARAVKANMQNIHTAVGGVVKNIRKFRYFGNYDTTKAVEIEFGGTFSTFKKKGRNSAELYETGRNHGAHCVRWHF